MSVDRYPTPQQIRAARASLTQTQAAELIFKPLRTWQNWEADVSKLSHRKMDPALFDYFLLKKSDLLLKSNS